MPHSQRALIVGSAVVLLLVIFELVRKRRLREEYAWLWLLFGVCVLAVTFVPFEWMKVLARMLGSEQPTAVIFFLGFIALILLCLQFSVRLSHQTEQVKNLGQQIALLKASQEPEKGSATSAPPSEREEQGAPRIED